MRRARKTKKNEGNEEELARGQQRNGILRRVRTWGTPPKRKRRKKQGHWGHTKLVRTKSTKTRAEEAVGKEGGERREGVDEKGEGRDGKERR